MAKPPPSNRLDYQTSAGAFDTRVTFSQLIEFCRLAQEDFRTLADWAKVHESKVKARAWLQLADNFEKIIAVLTGLAKGKTKTSIGYRQ
jgi:hypothetical protein